MYLYASLIGRRRGGGGDDLITLFLQSYVILYHRRELVGIDAFGADGYFVARKQGGLAVGYDLDAVAVELGDERVVRPQNIAYADIRDRRVVRDRSDDGHVLCRAGLRDRSLQVLEHLLVQRFGFGKLGDDRRGGYRDDARQKRGDAVSKLYRERDGGYGRANRRREERAYAQQDYVGRVPGIDPARGARLGAEHAEQRAYSDHGQKQSARRSAAARDCGRYEAYHQKRGYKSYRRARTHAVDGELAAAHRKRHDNAAHSREQKRGQKPEYVALYFFEQRAERERELIERYAQPRAAYPACERRETYVYHRVGRHLLLRQERQHARARAHAKFCKVLDLTEAVEQQLRRDDRRYDRRQRDYEYVRRKPAVRFLERKAHARQRRIERRREPRAGAARYKVPPEAVRFFRSPAYSVARERAESDGRTFAAEREPRKEREQTARYERRRGGQPFYLEHAASFRFGERYAAALGDGA